MQIVIDIPKEKYQGIISMAEEILDASTFCSPRYLYKAVLNGTPLPKGHGRLIDANMVCNEFEGKSFNTSSNYYNAIDAVDAAPTIIEADRAESEE